MAKKFTTAYSISEDAIKKIEVMSKEMNTSKSDIVNSIIIKYGTDQRSAERKYEELKTEFDGLKKIIMDLWDQKKQNEL